MSIVVDKGELTVCDGWGQGRTVEFVLCCHCDATVPYTTRNGQRFYFAPHDPYCSRCNAIQCERCAQLPCNPIEGRIELALSNGGVILEQRFTYRR